MEIEIDETTGEIILYFREGDNVSLIKLKGTPIRKMSEKEGKGKTFSSN